MIIIPSDVKCSFCKKTFCCLKCRMGHEEKIHIDELAITKEEEYITGLCYLCNGQKLPFGSGFDEFSAEMQKHVVDVHFPLSCGKCEKVFETFGDFKVVSKCCESVKVEVVMEEKENHVEESSGNNFVKTPINFDKPLTPLSKINMRWRRKSKEFTKIEGQMVVQEGTLTRQTSTPRSQGNLLTTNHFTDSSSYSTSSIHISSINCTSSTSSDSDAFSPPMPEAQMPKLVQPISPQRIQRPPTQSRSRTKMPVQATPLRQVMSKSIQRAIQQHGHYRQSPFLLQQRKMSFNSTGSSSEHTFSLMKLTEESPLDLRLSPALRRTSVESNNAVVQSRNDSDLIDLQSHIEEHNQIAFEEIQVIIRHSEIKSETSATSNYKSFTSDAGRSGSMPEIHFTPKIVGHNFLKKTISFETPDTLERSPTLLTTIIADDDDENDDVFYTPRATPKRFPRTNCLVESPFAIHLVDESKEEKKQDDSKSHSSLWSLVASVMQLAARKGEGISESLSSNDGMFKFSFKKPDFVKKAADYFTRRSDSHEEQPSKRRRTSSNAENRTASPAMKRQKIQQRKPIDRMRRLS